MLMLLSKHFGTSKLGLCQHNAVYSCKGDILNGVCASVTDTWPMAKSTHDLKRTIGELA